MRFPHLNDTRFPNIQQVNVYEFQNNFDYTRWSEKTEIKLCNVIWNSDYSDVVKFDTNQERDAWFDSLDETYDLVLETSARIVPEGYVKLPIPYDVMARYNYLFLDMPIATSSEHPIDYENNGGVKRWYFFIDRIVYLSPNTTQVYIQPDVWQIYQNDVDIRYMLLERGHAPVAASNTDTYLANPLLNNRYLLAPDVSFDKASINRSVEFLPFGNNKKYVCFASTCAPEQIASLGSVYADASYAPFNTLSYSDLSPRYGHQLQVNGLTFGNGYNYSGANTPASAGHSNGNRIANNLSVYAIEATECYGTGTFYRDVIQQCPQFLNTIQACFVVDSACLTLGTAYTIAGHTIRRCIGTSTTLLTKQLTKADFGFPSELQRFAKLYTSPYSQLELTDNDGNTYTINIEETSTLTAKSVVSVAFPYINMRVFFEGIGGIGSNTYSWRDLANNVENVEMSNSDWFKYCFDWQIPTFALFMDGETAYQLASFNRNVNQGINNALVAYHNTMRSANTAYENACDTADVAYTNSEAAADTARDNAHDSADTAKTNADASADTAKINADNSADCGKQNAYNSAVNSKTNSGNLAEAAEDNAIMARDLARAQTEVATLTNQTNADNSANGTYECAVRAADCQTNNQLIKNTAEAYVIDLESIINLRLIQQQTNKNTQDCTAANALCLAGADVQQRRTNASTFASSTSTLVGSVVQGAVSTSLLGASIGGFIGATAGSVVPVIGNLSVGALTALGGAVVGLVAGGVQAAISGAALGQINECSALAANNQQDYNNTSTTQSNAYMLNNQQYINGGKKDIFTAATLNTETAQTRNVTSTTKINAAQMKTYSIANNANTKDAQYINKDNAYNVATHSIANNKNVANQNAANTETVAKKNADNTKDTSYANSHNTQYTAKKNAERTQTTTKNNATNTYTTAEENADRTRDNTKDNAGYTQEVEELNAKELLENAANNSMAGILDARNAQPQSLGFSAGNAAPDYNKTRGIQIKVKTQSDSAIRQAGDYFVRYGYALNQLWDVHVSGLKLMNYFTYWKASEIWVDDRQSSNNSVQAFMESMFLRGVTVWNNPTEIGRINVYNN